MALAAVARAYYAAQVALSERTQRSALGLWSELDVADLVRSWSSLRLGERLFVALSTSQLLAASTAAQFVARALGEQGARSVPQGRLIPRSFAGVASDGRDLETLLFEPVIRVKTAIRDGYPPDRATEIGGSSLATITGTQVADMGRSAVGVAMKVEPAVTGWIRMLTPPSCGRCAVLAGRRYRSQEIGNFDRHPQCDCVAVPESEDLAGDLRTDPQAYFESLSAADQGKYFTKAGAQAIRDGADLSQVVNARRGARGLSQPGRLTAEEQRVLKGGPGRGQLQRVDVYGRQVLTTTEGATVRAIAGKRLAETGGTTRDRGARNRRAKTPRLMPEAIYELAGDDRDEAVRLLRRFGYIV